MPEILTNFQKELLKEIGKSKLSSFFIWFGGTALSYYYLQHRKSYDLDFLSKELLPDDYLLSQVNKIAENLKVKEIEEHKRFNRHEFWLKRGKENLKIEFVFYPFPDIKRPKNLEEFNIKINSIEDILASKTHAIFERTEPKDVFDFYCILQEKKIEFFSVFKWVKRKFGVEIDPVLFASKILEGASRLSEIRPIVLKKKFLNPNKMEKYFESKAEKYLKKKIK